MSDMSTQIEEDIFRNKMLTVKEVADYLRVDRVTVWRWCKQGTIPASQIGHHWRIDREDLLQVLKTTQPANLDSLEASSISEENDGANGDESKL